jgi:threonine dehydrogenase-like Zn-dependent dehydrogenase
MTKPGEIEFGEVTEPKVGRGQILSRAKQTGICDSNVPLNHDRHLFTPCSVVQGYESHGHVEAVGKALKDLGSVPRLLRDSSWCAASDVSRKTLWRGGQLYRNMDFIHDQKF